MKRVEFRIVEGTRDDGRRLRRIVEILAGGIYAFLDEEGYLKRIEGEEVRSPLPNPPPQGGRETKEFAHTKASDTMGR